MSELNRDESELGRGRIVVKESRGNFIPDLPDFGKKSSRGESGSQVGTVWLWHNEIAYINLIGREIPVTFSCTSLWTPGVMNESDQFPHFQEFELEKKNFIHLYLWFFPLIFNSNIFLGSDGLFFWRRNRRRGNRQGTINTKGNAMPIWVRHRVVILVSLWLHYDC
jgi:hypothetical protein